MRRQWISPRVLLRNDNSALGHSRRNNKPSVEQFACVSVFLSSSTHELLFCPFRLLRNGPLNSGNSIPTQLPELFSAALPPSAQVYCLGPHTGNLHQLPLGWDLGGGPCSSSWSFSLDLAGCMQVLANTEIYLPLPTALTQFSEGGCICSRDLLYLTT